ncbi:MAG: hypothetical protein ACLGGO_34745 [Coleofasciculus sp.]
MQFITLDKLITSGGKSNQALFLFIQANPYQKAPPFWESAFGVYSVKVTRTVASVLLESRAVLFVSD